MTQFREYITVRVAIVVMLNCALLFFIARRLYSSYHGIAERIGSSLMCMMLTTKDKCLAPFYAYQESRLTVQEWKKRCQQLQYMNEHLEAALIAAHAADCFARQTKELIEFQQRYAATSQQLSRILLVQRFGTSHFMWIDKGSMHGIVHDMVAVYKNSLLGRVVQVLPYCSKVQLVTDASCNIAAICTTTQATGIYQGSGDVTYASMNHVSHLNTLTAGDLIISSGSGLIYPEGFALGYIDSWTMQGLYYHIKIKPMYDVQTLQFCYVCYNTPAVASPL